MPLVTIPDILYGLSSVPNVFDPDGLIDVVSRPDVDYGRPNRLTKRRFANEDVIVVGNGRNVLNIDDAGPSANRSDFEDLVDFAPDDELIAVEQEAVRTIGPKRLREIQTRGIDAIAWYVPFHTRVDDWGIHIPISNLALFAHQAFQSVDATPTVRWKLALRALHQHELNHFAVEYFTAVWELLHGERTFFPSLRQLRSVRYGYILLEERLANAQMIRSVRAGGAFTKVKGKTESLHAFVRTQPQGYCHARLSTPDSKFFPLIQRVLRDRVSRTRAHFPQRHDRIVLRTLVDRFPLVDWQECPVHIYDDHWHYGSTEPIAWFIHRLQPSIEESDRFKKQLARLDPTVADRWSKTKNQLLEATSSGGLDFKKWPPAGKGAYSVKVSHGLRAHLRHQASTSPWIAEEIGRHKDMGHG